jgi:hypothetical protein
MISEARFRKLVRASAVYDLVVTAPFATPWTLAVALKSIGAVQTAFGLKGEVPEYSTGLALFGNLMGSVVLVWSLARCLSPEPRLGRLDALARGLFSIWMAYALFHGAAAAIAGFLVLELGWMIVQLLPLRPAEPLLRG